MARPLRETYSTTHPYIVERQDQEDGSITYEIWDTRPNSYRKLCSVEERLYYDDEDCGPTISAKSDAEMIARALNLMNGGLP